MERYQAAMILGAVGNSIGIKTFSLGIKTMFEFESICGRFDAIALQKELWPVGDTVITLLATSYALSEALDEGADSDLNQVLSRRYVRCLEENRERISDSAFREGCTHLRPGKVMGWHIPFDAKASGAGAAARTIVIGLRYAGKNEVSDLVAAAVEAGRMTHNHPLGFTGSVCTALFASFAIQGVPINRWGRKMLDEMGRVKSYCKKTIRHNEEYGPCWFYFETKWEMYLTKRAIHEAEADATAKFPTPYEAAEREKDYAFWSSDGCPGSRGHDAPMIAYDALLASSKITNDEERWREICSKAMIHNGRSDATGSIAGFLYGLLHGFTGVPNSQYQNVEFREELANRGRRLYELHHS